jgi:hypothetical protein
MGTGNLPDVTAPTVELDHINDIRNAMRVDFVGRAAGGSPTSGQNLGTAAVPWGTVYTNNVNVGGRVIDFDNLGATNSNNAVISGATRAASGQPDFLRAAGSGGGAEFDILGATTNLVYTANATSATVSTDITVSSLTVAPSTNNTCLINDSSYSGGNSTKYEGEGTGTITIDTAGSEITSRVGEYVALKGTNEIMLAFVESATTLRNCFRGFFFDDSGDPIVRETLSNNDTLTLMSLGWVFGEDNGTTFDVSYRSPYIQADEPASGVTDDYWFDQVNNIWKRYDGANWITIDRTLLGLVVIDGTDCIATRSLDFSKSFSDFVDLEVTLESVTKVRSAKAYSSISVYGATKDYHGAPVEWDISSDLESGLTEASDTLYYLYVTEQGDTIISDERPYNRVADLQGFYHPYHTWRYVGVCYNDGSSDLTSANSKNNNQAKVEVFTSSGEYLPLPNVDNAKVTVVGGGGGAGGSSGSGSSGGTTSFGSECSATGGSAGQSGAATVGEATGGNGGSGSGGDVNITGQDGGNGFVIDVSGLEANYGGAGGCSTMGGGGKAHTDFDTGSDVTGSGSAGNNYGGGGGGGGVSSQGTGGGGGGGGTSIKYISNLTSRVAVTIGSGGSGATSGGNGAQGICIVEY